MNSRSFLSSFALSTTSFNPSEECSVTDLSFGIEFSALKVASYSEQFEMSVKEAYEFFENIPQIVPKSFDFCEASLDFYSGDKHK